MRYDSIVHGGVFFCFTCVPHVLRVLAWFMGTVKSKRNRTGYLTWKGYNIPRVLNIVATVLLP